MSRRKLPLLVERTIADVTVLRMSMSARHEGALLDAALEMGTQLSCRKGCANCCYHPVLLSLIEGMHLFRWLTSRGRWTPSFRTRCVEASRATFGQALEIWLLSMPPCVLLDEAKGLCTAHEARPMACRTVFSLTGPEACHPQHLNLDAILPRGEVLEEFAAEETKLFKRHGLHRFMLPIPTALLISERVLSGEIDVEQVNGALMRKYLEEG